MSIEINIKIIYIQKNYSRAVVRPCTTAVVSGGKKNFEIIGGLKYCIKIN
jgi:hypothetical protein